MNPFLAFSGYFPLSIDPHFLVHYSPFHLLLNFLRIFALTKIEIFVYAFIQKSDSLVSESEVHPKPHDRALGVRLSLFIGYIEEPPEAGSGRPHHPLSLIPQCREGLDYVWVFKAYKEKLPKIF